MDRERARRALPRPYAEALRLRDAGSDAVAIAAALGVAPEAVPSLLQIGEAKVALLLTRAADPADGESPVGAGSEEAAGTTARSSGT